MKQFNCTRKAFGWLLAPLALMALPANAATLDVTQFNGHSDLFSGTDEDGTTYYFQIPELSGDGTCSAIGAYSDKTTLVIPEKVNVIDPYNSESEPTTIVVNKLNVTDNWAWEGISFNGCSALTDFVLGEGIQSVAYNCDYWNFGHKGLHFTSATPPSEVNLDVHDGTHGYYYYLVYAPDDSVDAYKDAFSGNHALVMTEGSDPKAAFEQMVTDSKALIINDNTYSGIYNANFVGQDADGNVFGFEDNGRSFRGAITSKATITIPESTARCSVEEYAFDQVPVTQFRVYYDDDDYYVCFPGCDKLKDVYLPSSLNSIIWQGNKTENIPNLHFTSSSVPEEVDMWRHNFAYGSMRYVVFAPEEALAAYKEVFGPVPCMVLAEGSDPKEEYEKEIAATDALVITPNNESGMNYVSWTGTDKNGTIFGFEDPGSEITFRGAITTASSITIPEKVCVSFPEYYYHYEVPVTRLCIDYYNENETDFPDCDNLTDIYVPACITRAEWHGEDFANRFNFHFSSPEPPSFYFDNGSGDNINLYVPDELLGVYTEALGSQDYILWSESPATPITVNIATPGTLAEEVSLLIEDLNQVRWLIMTGTPNELDLRMLRRLSRLEILDLSGTTGLESVGGCNDLKYLREVTLPDGITAIDYKAFYNCRNLSSINIPDGVTEIGESAFENVRRLRTIVIPASVKTIDGSAFCNSRLKSADLKNVVEINSSAFAGTKLSDVDLSSAHTIGYNAFGGSPLKTVKFGKDISYIGGYAFENCQLQGELVIPEKVTSLDTRVFAYNPGITKIVLHKDITSIAGDWYSSFVGCYPEVMECNILFPSDNNGFYDQDMSSCKLYVPALTLNEYLLHDNWLNFSSIEPLPYDLTTLDIDREYTLVSDKGIADKADLTMNARGESYGHLTVKRKTDLNLGNYTQGAQYSGNYWSSETSYYGSTIIPESTVTADKIEIKLNFYKDRWYFLSFPFDVNVKDIVVDEDALWVVRKYSGDARAKLEENTWQNMPDGTVLKAGEGYIFSCSVEDRDRVNLTITPAANGNALFAKDVVTKELAEYPSEFAHNASWNLTGNTYPAYLNLKGIDFDAPVTVWENNTYYAYSPVDDDYVLDPFQAFFVQRQSVEGGDVISLNPEARAHSRNAAVEIDFVSTRVARAPRANTRSLYNIYVNGENGSDRTRIVVNEAASLAYESNRDASKFMSTVEKVPQIFVNNNNVRMAIDERPLGNGIFVLGCRFGQSGEYSISIDTRNALASSIMLTDNVTGVTTDLMLNDYAFTADAGIDDNRFTITIGGTSGVENAVAEGMNISVDGNVLNVVADEAVEVVVVSADGKVVATGNSSDFSVTLDGGIYIVKAGGMTKKVNIGK